MNCTVGPGSSEWYAVETEHTARLRGLVLRDYGVDILGKEGSWFIAPQFLALHQIPFLHGQQISYITARLLNQCSMTGTALLLEDSFG